MQEQGSGPDPENELSQYSVEDEGYESELDETMQGDESGCDSFLSE
jgi:hypothetical protein